MGKESHFKSSCIQRSTSIPYFIVANIPNVALSTYDGDYIGFREFNDPSHFLCSGFIVPVAGKVKHVSILCIAIDFENKIHKS